MRFGIHTLDDFELAGKTVLCRVDINEPVDRATATLKDITRIEACVPTLRELSDKGARVVIMAHQGSDIEYKNFYTTRPHAAVLTNLLGREVKFIDDVCGPAARQAIRELKDGELLLLDNVRFMAEEQTLFEQRLRLTHEQQADTIVVRTLAPLADLYVCDAFAAAHRDQPTLCGFEQVLPSAMGRLFEKEYCVVSEMMTSPERPCVFVLGGAKADDAFLIMETVLKNGTADLILTGGVVANVLMAARGIAVGEGSMKFIQDKGFAGWIDRMKDLLAVHGDAVVTPSDVAFLENGARREVKVGEIPESAGVLDIGTETAAYYAKTILNAKTVFVNGPMGVFEQAETELGTRVVWDALGETDALTVLGGGDSITATVKYQKSDLITHVSTGGGALIRFVSGEEVPVVRALRGASARNEG